MIYVFGIIAIIVSLVAIEVFMYIAQQSYIARKEHDQRYLTGKRKGIYSED